MRKWFKGCLLVAGMGLGLAACGQPPEFLQCTGVADCAADTACIDGQCKGVYGREYRLTFDGAKIPEKKADGTVWDTVGGLPDAYCEFRTPNGSGQTDVAENTLSPNWDSTKMITLLVDQNVTFTCRDQDLQGDEKIFEKVVQITPEDVRNGSITLRNDRGFELMLKIRPNLK